MKRFVFVLAVVAALVLQGTAFAYSDWGWDPDDVSGSGGSYLDLRMIRRDLAEVGDHRVLRIIAWVWDAPIGDYWGMKVPLDSRGTGRADYMMAFKMLEEERSCWVRQLGTSHRVDGVVSLSEDSARCVVPAHAVHRDKRIRWRLTVLNYGAIADHYGVTGDRAPNTGWYR